MKTTSINKPLALRFAIHVLLIIVSYVTGDFKAAYFLLGWLIAIILNA